MTLTPAALGPDLGPAPHADGHDLVPDPGDLPEASRQHEAARGVEGELGDELEEVPLAVEVSGALRGEGPGADTVEFFIRRVDDGALTPKLFDLPVGGKLFLEQRAAGHFTLAGATDSEDLILVGTGTGVAPYRPMLHDQSTRARFGRTIILYSDRHVRDLGYLEEFRAMEDDGFRFFPTITGDEPAEAWEGLRGRVNRFLEPETYEQLTGQPLTPERCQVFLCGNPQMVVDVQEMLSPLGFQRHRKREPGQLHMEKYW